MSSQPITNPAHHAQEAREQLNFPTEFKVSRQKLKKNQEYGAVEPPKIDNTDDDLVDLAPLKLWSTKRQGRSQLLGLRWVGDRFKLSHFVGAVWLDEAQESIPLIVQSKLSCDKLAIDPVAMYVEVCSHLGEITSGLFGFEPDQNVIDGVELPQVTLLQIAVFLNELGHFARKYLRHEFIRIRTNLAGKVKGKIIIGDNIRRNTVKGRADKFLCQYHIIDSNTVANQILRAALTLCMKYLGASEGRTSQQLHEWARICSALARITERRITQADFQAMHYSGLMKKYKPIHRLAKMIFRRLHTDGTGSIEGSQAVTVPFWLDMNALFERYVQGKLIQAGADFKTQVPISVKEGNLSFQCRPDFVIGDGFAVLDAKYKAILEERLDEDVIERGVADLRQIIPCQKNGTGYSVGKIIHADYYQIIAYSLLVTQLDKHQAATESPLASIACLVVPFLSSDSGDNEILMEGLKKLTPFSRENDLSAFRKWVKDSRRYPYFELPLAFRMDAVKSQQESRSLFVVILPCYLPIGP
jgi:5-methylcytosine-specific restriction enzyme subunit McrC